MTTAEKPATQKPTAEQEYYRKHNAIRQAVQCGAMSSYEANRKLIKLSQTRKGA